MPSYNSPLFDNAFPLNTKKSPSDRILSMLLRGTTRRAALMKALNGANAGGTAAATEKRVAHSTSELGGVRPIETRTVINRATTNADKTGIDSILSMTSRIATPRNLAGTYPA